MSVELEVDDALYLEHSSEHAYVREKKVAENLKLYSKRI